MSQIDTTMQAALCNSNLAQEWQTLQNNYEQYETTVLTVKLLAVVLCAIGWWLAAPTIVAILTIVLWLQEAILKTFQSRLGVRLLRVESALKQNSSSEHGFQLHTDWLASRPSALGLLREYILSAAKPTVAFPYAVLLVAIAANGLDLIR
jgi:hypothetical protein